MGLYLICSLFLLVGCGPNRMRGSIGGETFEVETAMFSEYPEALGSDGLVFVVLSELPDACGAYSAYQQAALGLQSPDDQADLWAKSFPEDFWEALVVIRVTDPAGTLELQTLNGLTWYDLLELPNRFFVRFTHNLAHRDAAWFDGTGDTDAYVSEYLSHQGTLRVKEHRPGVQFDGVVDTLVVAPARRDAEPQGVVRLRFDARICPDVLGL